VAAALEGLEREGLVRPATEADTVDGVRAELVVEPASVEEAGQALRAAHRAGKKVVVVGGGSKLGLGNPPERADLLLSTARLDGVLEHAAGDLVVKVQAGARLADLQAALAPAGQWLALDPPEPGATVGGVVAANASGPRRLRYGTVRDLIIGITVVLADGTVAHAGGKVVKNVAGYDLAKLFCGSLGTLGLIAEATFRLHPRPAAAAVVTLEVERVEQVGEATSRLLRSTLAPSAIEFAARDLPGRAGGIEGRLTVLFEGIRPGVEAQAAAAARLLGEVGAAEVLGPGGTEAAISLLGALPWEKAEVSVKATCPPAELTGALTDLWEATATRQLGDFRVAAHAGSGVVRAGFDVPELHPEMAALLAEHEPGFVAEPHERLARFVSDARERLTARQGGLVVVEAPPELKRAVDVWGPPGDAIGLMRRVKRQFDPDRLLSPGRFVGGI
jgi:glycolate oxidase FAD binding subunit